MSAYNITGFLRTAYRPIAFCVPSKTPLNTAYQKGGGTLIYVSSSHLILGNGMEDVAHKQMVKSDVSQTDNAKC